MAAGKLVWDQTGQRYYEMGVSKGVLYVQKSDGTYEDGVAWNGLTSVTESPDGAEANDLWADNIKYASFRSVETFGGTIEAYTYPDEWAVCDGSAEPVTGVYLHNQKRTPFGFCFRTEVGNDTAGEDDDGYLLHIIWNATASPSDRDYETINDSPDAITFSWEFDTTPVAVTGYKPTSHITINSTKLDTTGKTNLAALEDILYGKDATTDPSAAATKPTLPTPLTVLTTMGYTTP